jgi:tetratricopeptide (TPR) repeat protein
LYGYQKAKVIEQPGVGRRCLPVWPTLPIFLLPMEIPDESSQTVMEPSANTASADGEARKLFERALENQHAGHNEEAISLYSELIDLGLLLPNAYNNLAILLSSLQRQPAAIACFRRALVHAPQTAALHSNLGKLLADQGAFEEAVAECRKAIELEPKRPEYHHHLGLLYHRLGDYSGAIECFDRALLLDPARQMARWDRALAFLAGGDLVRGFADYDLRFDITIPGREPDRQLRSVRRRPVPLWQGEELAGRTLHVYAEQGLGDTLQFVRFLPTAARRGARVIFDCQRELLRLLRGFPGVAELRKEGGPLPEADLHLPLLSLPHRLGTTLQTIPPAPYLAPPSDVSPPRFVRHPGTLLAVGIVWAGRPENAADQTRSMKLDQFLPLGDLPGLALYSLQKGERAKDIVAQGASALVGDLGSNDRDLADTARLVAQLDLVITIDSAIAHLVGALGRPGFVLLPFAPDWRWAAKPEDSPWYPSLRLFRQQSPGDWEGVMRRVHDVLAESLAHVRPQ